MKTQDLRGSPQLSRRSALKSGTGAVLGAMATSLPSQKGWTTGFRASSDVQATEELFRELDAKIEAGMARYHIPGVAIGVFYQGEEYVRGYGVTNVDEPGAGRRRYPLSHCLDHQDLYRHDRHAVGRARQTRSEAPVRRYLPDFRVADEAASAQVTLRQCLNHSAGWVGDDERDFGRGEEALARYVNSMRTLPQLTPPGAQFAYNNTALDVAGRVIEVVTGQPYEEAVRALLLDPLELSRTRFFTDELAGYAIAGCHSVVDDRAVFTPELWYLPRNGHPDGGLISSAREQLHYARFHMGDGRAADGTPLLTPASLQAMRANPGPGGTLVAEIDGFGVSFGLRRTAEGVRVVMHGGSWSGQHSGFFFVPERDFAMTMLTNSDGGTQLRLDLFYDDWVLQRFAGLHNPPAEPTRLPAARLAEYEGAYLNRRYRSSWELARDGAHRPGGRWGAAR